MDHKNIILLALKQIFLVLKNTEAVDAIKVELDNLKNDITPEYHKIITLIFSQITKEINLEFKSVVFEYLKFYTKTCRSIFPLDNNYILLMSEIDNIKTDKQNIYNRNISDVMYILCLAIINSGLRSPLFLTLKYICEMKNSNLSFLSCIFVFNTEILKNKPLNGEYERLGTEQSQNNDVKSSNIKKQLINIIMSFEVLFSKTRERFFETLKDKKESLKQRQISLKSQLIQMKEFNMQKILSLGSETIGLTVESFIFDLSSKMDNKLVCNAIKQHIENVNKTDHHDHEDIANNIKIKVEREDSKNGTHKLIRDVSSTLEKYKKYKMKKLNNFCQNDR